MVRQQTISWSNVGPDLCRHMVSLSRNELAPSLLILRILHHKVRIYGGITDNILGS